MLSFFNRSNEHTGSDGTILTMLFPVLQSPQHSTPCRILIPPTPRATGNTIELSKSLVHPWLSPHKGIDSLEVWQLLIHLGEESRTLALYTHGVQCLTNVISFRRTPVLLRQRLIVVKYFSVSAPLFDSSVFCFWTVTSQTSLQSLFSPHYHLRVCV